MWKRERMSEDKGFIENTCHGVGSKNAGWNWNVDVVLSTDHVVLLANGFPIFVSGTSGIMFILNYRSVSPIWDKSNDF